MYHPQNGFQPTSVSREIIVTGKGEIDAQPDTAQVVMEVRTEGKDVSQAQQENALIMNRVINSLVALNIPREAIQTTAYTIFPSYVFWETDSFEGFSVLQKGKGFVKILPHNSEPAPLNSTDVSVVCSFLKYGTVMPILQVDFDVNDKIQILDGLFKGQEGLVVAVNRRNKRVNLEIQFMNGTRVIGLSYELIKKMKE